MSKESKEQSLFELVRTIITTNIEDKEELDTVLKVVELAEVYEQYIDATTNSANLQQYIQNLIIRINTLRE